MFKPTKSKIFLSTMLALCLGFSVVGTSVAVEAAPVAGHSTVSMMHGPGGPDGPGGPGGPGHGPGGPGHGPGGPGHGPHGPGPGPHGPGPGPHGPGPGPHGPGPGPHGPYDPGPGYDDGDLLAAGLIGAVIGGVIVGSTN